MSERVSWIATFKNLIDNHGFLDQVIFIPQTNNTESLEWLASTVKRTPLYQVLGFGDYIQWGGMDGNVIFIKIDGDIIFLEDHTVSTIVKTKLDHPDSLIVSANVINQAALQALHSHPGVALPYLPELSSSDQSRAPITQDWRATDLPTWKGPADFKILKGYPPPSESYRWLPLADEDGDRTPIGMSIYGDNGPELDDWTVHAQQHYSFLQHLEDGNLYRYKFPVWVDPTDSVSPNFLCLRAGDPSIVKSIIQQDSDKLSLEVAQKLLGRDPGAIIDGKGLAAHYSIEASLGGLESTDLLHRYRAYAEEMAVLEYKFNVLWCFPGAARPGCSSGLVAYFWPILKVE
ncbi:hypothetical protein ANOM_009969 [Aspergillus nomiae NRRL 13137]|uniref:Uncharacterized protein n=1 Tax=Aspergillus nomiae NRRL (strain ATCC 15546 / NRRL 13137 / CBS 260.88 / M93) TaxID=1509407 RepID=A0A0L1IMI1_ASPN3|nr:uncharacterized protein ANOM_009969 [Aspergillus nomiae NRRL 13137]KNG80811.1 hypothetical protein ANOM_009969 [Aspergillus nomiae NRRL 13137]